MAMKVGHELKVMYPKAAGIDIGSASHFVAVPAHSTDEPVREFGVCTQDLLALAHWLKRCGVDEVEQSWTAT